MSRAVKITRKQTENTSFRSTLRHFSRYLTADVAARAIGFVSIPVYTRLLTPADYGIINIFNTYVTIFLVIGTINIYSSVSRYYYENKEDFRQFFGSVFTVVLLLFAVFSLLLALLQRRFAALLALPLDVIIFFIPVLIYRIMASFHQQILKPQYLSKEIALVSVLAAYVGFGLKVLAIVFLEEARYRGPVYGAAVVGVVMVVFYLIRLRAHISFKWNREHIRYAIEYAVPLIPYALGGIILAQFDRLMINSTEGAGDAGLYSLAYNIGMLISIFYRALMLSAWMPKYFDYMGRRDYKAHDRDIDRMFRIVAVAALGLILFGKELCLLLSSSEYHEAAGIIPIIVLGYVFECIHYIYLKNATYAKKTIYSSIVLISCGGLNILLNAVFIPRYGYVAAAYTTVASYFAMAVAAWAINKYALKMYSTALKHIVPAFGVIAAGVAGTHLAEALFSGILVGVLVKSALLLVSVYVLGARLLCTWLAQRKKGSPA